jgi:hypothetical protein
MIGSGRPAENDPHMVRQAVVDERNRRGVGNHIVE